MGRNHKKVTLQAVELAKELNVNLSFNNYVNGEFIKPYMTEVRINSHVIKGLQSWDNKDFNSFMLALRELVTKEDITGHNIKTVNDLELYMKGSKTNTTVKRVGKDGEKHAEYAKDSYRWGQIDIIDRFLQFQECDSVYRLYAFDDTETLEEHMEKRKGLIGFFTEYYKKLNKCNPNKDFWTAERLETFYITSKILPKFIKEELKVNVSNNNIEAICKLYMQSRDSEYKAINSEVFADSLHRLIGDVQVKDSKFYEMGLI